jgi:aspartyl-tRNA(Asn)/glutamyl-tRNA(Gln) amidotransferase subunit B
MPEKNSPAAYEAIIGLEIHVQLKTRSKMFCTCDNRGEDAAPNTTICPICTGQPGTLPVPNRQAVEWGVKTALALGCTIPGTSKFDRKHYFYPDLPKGYQISQFDEPVGQGGGVTVRIGEEEKHFRLTRLHLEEDAGKLTHPAGAQYSLVDLNRAGTPLMEIVTEPDFRSPQEAKTFLQELRLIVRYLGVSDADMEKGHLRCDANVSLRPVGDGLLYPKTEVKNMNSFKAVERALTFEIERQRELWESGTPPTKQATRGWDEGSQTTIEQRVKESSDDYRYFPEPDIPPLAFSREEVALWKADLPEMPSARRARFADQYALPLQDIDVLVEDKHLADFTEHVISELKGWIEAKNPNDHETTWHSHKAELSKLIANWTINRLTKALANHKQTIHDMKVTAENLAELVTFLFEKKINVPSAQQVLEEMVMTGADPSEIIAQRGLGQVSDSGELEKILDTVIAANQKVAADVRAGKQQALQFLIGQVMKETKGRANPTVVSDLLIHKLK